MAKQVDLFKTSQASYRKRQEPFVGADAANAALLAFYDDLQALVEKHRIKDATVGVQVNIVYEEGDEGSQISVYHMGDVNLAESIASYALGAFRSWRNADLATTVERAAKKAKAGAHA